MAPGRRGRNRDELWLWYAHPVADYTLRRQQIIHTSVRLGTSMPRKSERTRQRIVEAANRLFYHKGYNQTSFQDISEATGIPRGNFYYYFKTKDEILNAVVNARIDELNSVLNKIQSETPNPVERLMMFADFLDTHQNNIIESGCPVGSLSSELAKDAPELQQKSTELFSVLRQWFKQQFTALGLTNADELAMDLLTMLQGVSIVACAFKDMDYLIRSQQQIRDWIKTNTLN